MEETLSKMRLVAANGFILVDPIREPERTSSGIHVGVQTIGDERGVVLSIGPPRSGKADELPCCQVGDIIHFPASQGHPIFDPGLDRTVMCLGQANVMAREPASR